MIVLLFAPKILHLTKTNETRGYNKQEDIQDIYLFSFNMMLFI